MTKKQQDSKSLQEALKDVEWFERRVAELKAELDKLSPNRQELLRRELDEEGDTTEPGKVEE